MATLRRILVELDYDEASLEEMIVHLGQMQSIKDGIDKLQLPVPDALISEMQTTQRHVDLRMAEEKQRRLGLLKARRETLLSQKEKRRNVEDEIAALEAELAE